MQGALGTARAAVSEAASRYPAGATASFIVGGELPRFEALASEAARAVDEAEVTVGSERTAAEEAERGRVLNRATIELACEKLSLLLVGVMELEQPDAPVQIAVGEAEDAIRAAQHNPTEATITRAILLLNTAETLLGAIQVSGTWQRVAGGGTFEAYYYATDDFPIHLLPRPTT